MTQYYYQTPNAERANQLKSGEYDTATQELAVRWSVICKGTELRLATCTQTVRQGAKNLAAEQNRLVEEAERNADQAKVQNTPTSHDDKKMEYTRDNPYAQASDEYITIEGAKNNVLDVLSKMGDTTARDIAHYGPENHNA